MRDKELYKASILPWNASTKFSNLLDERGNCNISCDVWASIFQGIEYAFDYQNDQLIELESQNKDLQQIVSTLQQTVFQLNWQVANMQIDVNSISEAQINLDESFNTLG